MLDTNVLIGCLRRNNHLIEKIEQAGKAHDLAISSITFGELMVGIMRNDTPRRRSALKKVLAPMKILDFGQDAAAEFAKIKVSLQESGTPIGPYDMQIAAHAISANQTLVTHNVQEFERIQNLNLLDWEL